MAHHRAPVQRSVTGGIAAAVAAGIYLYRRCRRQQPPAQQPEATPSALLLLITTANSPNPETPYTGLIKHLVETTGRTIRSTTLFLSATLAVTLSLLLILHAAKTTSITDA